MKIRFTLLGVLFTMMSFAQSTQNFIDINTGGYTSSAFDEYNNELFATDDYLYFFANDGVHGSELWRSDGTVAGTHLVKDINPGAGSAFELIISDLNGFIFEVGGKVVFAADDGVNGRELWTTDGTEAGTAMLKDIYAGSFNGIGENTSYDAIVMDDILYFQGTDEEYGLELWRSDGTTSGTYMVKNIRNLGASSYPSHFMEFNGLLYFSGDEGWIQGGLGQELYVSDGTEAGTYLVKNIANGSDSSEPEALTNAGDFFYFIANDGLGQGLWKSDGTDAGTTLIKDGFDFINDDLVAVGDKLFFTADDDVHGPELWTSDGTNSGTVMVKDINTTYSGSYPQDFMSLNGKAYFIAESADFSDNLWMSDGTEAGTMKVLDTYGNYPTVFNDEIIFAGPAANGFGQALWHTDGTAAGSQIVAGLSSDYEINRPHSYTAFQNKLFYIAFDYTYGHELWAYTPGEEVTKVSRIGKADNYSISPNPADQFVTLDFKEANNLSVRIYNALGSLVLTKENIVNTSIKIDISEFQSGIYFSEVTNDKNQKLTKRFVVK